MRVTLPQSHETVSFSSPPAKIIAVTPRAFTYEFSLAVNASRALRAGVSLVSVTAHAASMPRPTSRVKSAADILGAVSARKAAESASASSVIGSTVVDVTSRVDNSAIKGLLAGAALDNHATDMDIVMPADVTLPAARLHYRTAAIETIRTGTDPADACLFTAVRDPKRVQAGLAAKRVTSAVRDSATLRVLSFSSVSSRSLGRGTLSRVARIKKSVTSVVVRGQILLPVTALSQHDAFFLVARAMTPTGVSLGEVRASVDHTRALADFNTPTVPPIARLGGSTPGRLIVECKQVDPRGVGIAVYRRFIGHVDTDFLSGDYQLVGFYEADVSDGFVRIADVDPGAKAVIYRVVALGRLGGQSRDFSSVVHRPQTSTVPGTRRREVPRGIALVASNTDTGIAVEATSVPPEAASVAFMRRDMTLHDRSPSFVNVTSPFIKIADHDAPVTVDDMNVKPGHVYEYTCVMITRDGSEHTCVGSAVIRRSPRRATGVVASISGLTVGSDSVPGVSFTVSTDIQDNGLSKTLQSLRSSNVSSLFETEVTDEKSDLTDLIAHGVSRVDLMSGDTVEFDSVVDGAVVDDGSTGVPLPIPGRRYRYTASTQVRSADSLLKSRIVDAVDRFGRTWTYRPSKYLNPTVLETGTLLSANDTSSQHPEDPFSMGDLGNSTVVEVTIPSVTASSLADVAVARGTSSSVVSWSMTGDLMGIDHFEVYIVVSDSHSLVARVQATRAQSYDVSVQLAPAGTQYAVVPVLSDFSHGRYVTVSD